MHVTEGIEDTFADWDNQVKGDFPLQLYTIHYMRRSHSYSGQYPLAASSFPARVRYQPS